MFRSISQEIEDIKNHTIPHFKRNSIINYLFLCFEALWPKLLPLDLKTSVYFFSPHPLHEPKTGCTQFNRPFDGLLSSLSCSHQSLRWWNTSYSFMRKNTNPLFRLLKHVISANIFAKQTNKLCMYLINGSSYTANVYRQTTDKLMF